jgi:hypothetical protein
MPDPTPVTDPNPEEPRTLLDKIGPALAVGLTALAAVFGSMSAAQLQQAMYWKSQAAQDQSRSTNQWSLFGFKRSRALEMEAAAARSRSDSGFLRFTFLTEADAGGIGEAVQWLNGDGPPRTELPPPDNMDLARLVADIRARKPEADLLALAGRIPVEQLNKAIDDGENFIYETTEVHWDGVVKAAKKAAQKVIDEAARNKAGEPVDPVKKARADAVQALVFAMEDRRYRGEGALNNALGYLYEARVKFSAATSDGHRRKSQVLGYAMLVAQIGAVAASLALARKRGFSLWLVAGGIGLVALAFGAYALVPASLLAF